MALPKEPKIDTTRKGKGKAIAKRSKKHESVTTPQYLPDSECAGCGELYEESIEEWLGCRQCKTWYELSCAGMIGKSQAQKDAFTCKDCQ